jgi:hypothetical protein
MYTIMVETLEGRKFICKVLVHQAQGRKLGGAALGTESAGEGSKRSGGGPG